MKCIYCDKDSNYKDRSDGKCSGCSKRFAFEPKNGDKLTDKAFEAALKSVSEDGTVKWMPEHLRYEIIRRKLKSNYARGYFGTTLTLGGIAGLLGYAGVIAAVPVFGVFGIGFGIAALTSWSAKSGYHSEFTLSLVESMIERWTAAHGAPRGLSKKKLRNAPYREIPSEILDYSFDRVVICDRDETVDFFIANQFHFENNCAILGFNRYPEHVFEAVLRMLQNNPKLLVLAVHDATVKGCEMSHVVAYADTWFAGKARVIDIGLRPEHSKFFKGLEEKSSAPVHERKGISAKDAKWLSSFQLSLGVIRPSQLIKRVFRAIQELENSPALTKDEVYFLGSEASVSDGGGDSFG